jgi:hypothetical protein
MLAPTNRCQSVISTAAAVCGFLKFGVLAGVNCLKDFAGLWYDAALSLFLLPGDNSCTPYFALFDLLSLKTSILSVQKDAFSQQPQLVGQSVICTRLSNGWRRLGPVQIALLQLS